MGFLKPKRPEPTAKQVAIEARQERALDEEIAEQEGRLRAQRRGQLGTRSLLAGAPTTRSAAASQMGRGGTRSSAPSAAQRANILGAIRAEGGR